MSFDNVKAIDFFKQQRVALRAHPNQVAALLEAALFAMQAQKDHIPEQVLKTLENTLALNKKSGQPLTKANATMALWSCITLSHNEKNEKLTSFLNSVEHKLNHHVAFHPEAKARFYPESDDFFLKNKNPSEIPSNHINNESIPTLLKDGSPIINNEAKVNTLLRESVPTNFHDVIEDLNISRKPIDQLGDDNIPSPIYGFLLDIYSKSKPLAGYGTNPCQPLSEINLQAIGQQMFKKIQFFYNNQFCSKKITPPTDTQLTEIINNFFLELASSLDRERQYQNFKTYSPKIFSNLKRWCPLPTETSHAQNLEGLQKSAYEVAKSNYYASHSDNDIAPPARPNTFYKIEAPVTTALDMLFMAIQQKELKNDNGDSNDSETVSPITTGTSSLEDTNAVLETDDFLNDEIPENDGNIEPVHKKRKFTRISSIPNSY